MSNYFLKNLVSGECNFDISMEAFYGDAITFLKEPDNYLDQKWATDKYQDGALYTSYLSQDGAITCNINRIGNELLKVNAYTEALALYSKYLESVKKIYEEVSKKDKDNLSGTIDMFQRNILDTVEAREEYTSNRKATLARFEDIIKTIHE